MTMMTELAVAADPCAVMQAAGMQPDPWQAELMRSDQWALALCSRQSGKSTAGAALALHTAVAIPGSLTLMTAPTDRQATELFRSVGQFYRACFGRAMDEDCLTQRRLELSSGSRVIAIPGHDDANLRVFSGVSLLLVDEACRVKDTIFAALTPMLATSNGRLVCLTTSWFRRGFFYTQWKEGGDDWLRVKVTADEVGRIGEEFLARERRNKSHFAFRQEYFAEWGADGDAAFPYEVVEAAMVDGLDLYEPERVRHL